MTWDLTTVETKQLWWFHDGAIMSPAVRQRLRAAWGFCPRHTWLHFSSECELRGTPRGTIVLYEDLLGRAVEAVGARRGWASRLAADDACLTCEYLEVGDTHRIEQDWISETAAVNRRRRTTVLLQQSRGIWFPRTCPPCADGSGIRCRQHLIAGPDGPAGAAERARLAEWLTGIHRRVDGVSRAISWPRRPVRPDEWAALVETLGWFAGWDGARGLLDEQPSPG